MVIHGRFFFCFFFQTGIQHIINLDARLRFKKIQCTSGEKTENLWDIRDKSS